MSFSTTINRATIPELKQAIKDLEARGYKVASPIWDLSKRRKDFDHRPDRYSTIQYKGEYQTSKFTVRMVKDDVHRGTGDIQINEKVR